GWWIVGALGVGGCLWIWSDAHARWVGQAWPGVALYYGVLVFNLVMTAWIGEWLLVVLGLTLHVALAVVCVRFMRAAAWPPSMLGGVAKGAAASAPAAASYERSAVPDVDRRHLRARPASAWPPALSAGADAGAALSLQPGVRGVRQDPVSRAHPPAPPHRRAVRGRRGGMRRPHGVDPGRRAAHVSRHRAPGAGAGRPEEVRLPVHERDSLEGEARGRRLHAVQVPFVFRAHGRPPRGARRGGVPRRCVRRRRGGDR